MGDQCKVPIPPEKRCSFLFQNYAKYARFWTELHSVGHSRLGNYHYWLKNDYYPAYFVLVFPGWNKGSKNPVYKAVDGTDSTLHSLASLAPWSSTKSAEVVCEVTGRSASFHFLFTYKVTMGCVITCNLRIYDFHAIMVCAALIQVAAWAPLARNEENA